MNNIQLPEDEIIRDMLPDFVESWRRDMMNVFPLLLETKNVDEMYRLGHTLRGSGRQFGLLQMSEYGSTIQQLAKEQDWIQLTQMTDHITNELQFIQQYLIENGIAPADRFVDLPSNL